MTNPSTKKPVNAAAGASDIAGFVMNTEGEVLRLNNPVTGEPLLNADGQQMTITLLGKDSDEFRAAQRDIADRRINKRVGSGKISMDRIDAEAVETLAKVTRDWTLVYNGEVPPCNFAKAREIYTKYPWIREQVDEFVNDRANFLHA